MSSYMIIGIHGLNNKPPEAELKSGWTEAIREGLKRNVGRALAGIEFDLVYWADLMYPTPLKPDPGSPDPDPLEYDLAPYTQVPGTGPLPRHEDSFLRQVKNAGKEALGGTLDKGTAIPGVSGIAGEVMERKTPDLYRYYSVPETRADIRQRLSHALRAAHGDGRRMLLIAHSMGSIVAFDILSAIGGEVTGFRVRHFITVGSPLGLHEVKDKIRAEGRPLRVPEMVERWTNFADRKDFVAVDTQLRTDYGWREERMRIGIPMGFAAHSCPIGAGGYASGEGLSTRERA